MSLLSTLLQIAIPLAVVNVWLVRSGRPTPFRGGGAANLRDELAYYGLPGWAMVTVGVLKLGLAALLLAGLAFPALTTPAALGMAALMAGAVFMHLNVRDPLHRALPATGVLAASLFVAFV